MEARKLRFKVQKINVVSGDTQNDWGVWSGQSVLEHLDHEDGEDDEVMHMVVGETCDFFLADMEGSDKVRVTRVPDDTPVTDPRGWFDRLQHWIRNVDFLKC